LISRSVHDADRCCGGGGRSDVVVVGRSRWPTGAPATSRKRKTNTVNNDKTERARECNDFYDRDDDRSAGFWYDDNTNTGGARATHDRFRRVSIRICRGGARVQQVRATRAKTVGESHQLSATARRDFDVSAMTGCSTARARSRWYFAAVSGDTPARLSHAHTHSDCSVYFV